MLNLFVKNGTRKIRLRQWGFRDRCRDDIRKKLRSDYFSITGGKGRVYNVREIRAEKIHAPWLAVIIGVIAGYLVGDIGQEIIGGMIGLAVAMFVDSNVNREANNFNDSE